jgi:hypothetical protein
LKLKIETTAYARKSNDPHRVEVIITIDENALATVLGNRAFNNRSREAKLLRGIIRGGVRELPCATPE